MPETSYTRWALPIVIIAVAILLSILAFTFRDQIVTFVRFSPTEQSTAASITVISCVDEGQDGTCQGDLGRIGVNLQLTQPDGTVLTGSTDQASGQYTFTGVESGTHSLETLLPFPGVVRSENPQIVQVSDTGVTVFVAVTATGESSIKVQKIMTNPITIDGNLKEVDPIPGQHLIFDILVQTIDFNQAPMDLAVTDVFETECIERIEQVSPPAARDGNALRWNLENVKGRYSRRLTYSAVVRDLNEILPRTCTNSVTVTDASGVTVGATSLDFNIGAIPDRAMLDMRLDDRDLNGGALQQSDEIQYDVRITNLGRKDAANVTYRSDFPDALENPAVVEAPAGAVVNVQPTGGQFGAGFIEISDFGSTMGDTVRLAFKANIRSDARRFTSVALTGTAQDEQGGSVFVRLRHKVGQVIELIEAAS
jgi:hypothetical protein